MDKGWLLEVDVFGMQVLTRTQAMSSKISTFLLLV